ncbi:MAG: MMPL family transporter [Desertimonas sp.]
MLARLARACVHHRWRVIGVWIALLIVVNGIASGIGPDYNTSFTLPDGESKDVQDTLLAFDPNQGFSSQLVVQAPQGIADPAVQTWLEEVTDYTVAAGVTNARSSGEGETADGRRGACAGIDPSATDASTITATTPYQNPGQISENGEIGFVQLDIRELGFTELTKLGTTIEECTSSLDAPDGVRLEFGGDLFGEFELPESEIYGLIAAVIILVVAFGSILAMGLPIGTALLGLGVAFALVSLASHVFDIPDFATSMVAMIGIGVGIDYALFIVTRYRECLARGRSVEDSVVEAINTAGRAVLFAGITVIISLLGLMLMGLSFVNGMAIASVAGVAMMILGSLTLLPALLGWVGTRIDHTTRAALIALALFLVGAIVAVTTGRWALVGAGVAAAAIVMVVSIFVRSLRRHIPHRTEPPKEQRFWYRWSRFIQHRPWPSALAATGLLVLLAVPLFSIRLGFSDLGNLPETQTVRRAYDLLADGFGPGSNGPFIITVEGDAAQDEAQFGAFMQTLDQTDGVARAIPMTAMEGFQPGPLQLIRLDPLGAPQDESTYDLVHELRDEIIPASGVDAKVGGFTAGSADFATYLADRMAWLIGVVLLLSFVLLMAVFRSVLVPLKAVIMNLLSIGASYGILVAIFQWGWGMELIGVDRAGPIEAWVPMFLFAIVFGLSMDYEVFLLSRIKEEYDRTKNNEIAVADGLAATARVITAAALIMFCVFAAFSLGDDRQLKLFGLGLAIAVLLDATIVRMVLVPATMELLGDRNWWLPRWLDRILPNIDVEGGHAAPPSAPPPTPAGE